MKKNVLKCAFACLVIVVLFQIGIGNAQADMMFDFELFSTGVDDNCDVLTEGTTDTHWTIAASPGGAANAIVQTPFAGWLGHQTNSRWIGSTTNGSDFVTPGTYDYEMNFDLTGFVPESAVITGNFLSDDSAEIFVNDMTTSISGGGFVSLTAFTLNSGNSTFNAGINTLRFRVNNAAVGDNPSGLQVEFTAATAIPEPSSFALFGVLGLGIFKRRR
ncbi:MAG: PEP-CTERM sorting domain-containing protein [Planctomycetota bacterium]